MVNIKISTICLGLGALFSVLLLFGCPIADGYMSVQGVVYAWVDAPADAESTIYVGEAMPAHITTIPLEGVSLWVFADNVSEARLLADIPEEYALDVSDADGQVGHSGSAPTGAYQIGIKVAKAGYQSASCIVWHDNNTYITHDIVVVLVSEASMEE